MIFLLIDSRITWDLFSSTTATAIAGSRTVAFLSNRRRRCLLRPAADPEAAASASTLLCLKSKLSVIAGYPEVSIISLLFHGLNAMNSNSA
jgi:hypothetical protein